MYEGAVTSVRILVKRGEFRMTIGLHQGSAQSPYLFALIMNELTAHIQKEIPWCMLFADDIVLVNESRDGVNAKHERWWKALGSKDFKISRQRRNIWIVTLVRI